jgi:hypothetical protein
MDTTTTILGVTGGGDEDPSTPQSKSRGRPGAVAATGLWLSISAGASSSGILASPTSLRCTVRSSGC